MTARPDMARLVPPSIADERGRAFGQTLARAAGEPAFRRLLLERIADVGDETLPFLIREFSIADLVEPGMKPAAVRALLSGSYALHARMGFRDAVRTGLGMIGVTVESWTPWYARAPKGAPGTHRIRVRPEQSLFEAEGMAITARLQRAVGRMIDGTKRWSQDVGVEIAVESRAAVAVGMVVAQRIRVSPSLSPITTLQARPPIFVGALFTARLRIRPEIPA